MTQPQTKELITLIGCNIVGIRHLRFENITVVQYTGLDGSVFDTSSFNSIAYYKTQMT